MQSSTRVCNKSNGDSFATRHALVTVVHLDRYERPSAIRIESSRQHNRPFPSSSPSMLLLSSQWACHTGTASTTFLREEASSRFWSPRDDTGYSIQVEKPPLNTSDVVIPPCHVIAVPLCDSQSSPDIVRILFWVRFGPSLATADSRNL